MTTWMYILWVVGVGGVSGFGRSYHFSKDELKLPGIKKYDDGNRYLHIGFLGDMLLGVLGAGLFALPNIALSTPSVASVIVYSIVGGFGGGPFISKFVDQKLDAYKDKKKNKLPKGPEQTKDGESLLDGESTIDVEE